ncbi:hypothetical protein [Streptomyces sp. NPDC047315]|uniref:hypothetical protein n=1 Tax=Streptomyces sp. NPDC047315 TaxID=3155142 RepID=UPI00340A1B02
MTSAVSHATTAAALAALLPARRRQPWQVGPAGYGVRPNAATSRIANGDRALIIAESGGVIEVFVDEAGTFPVAPEVVVSATSPDPVADLARGILHTVLPSLERRAASATIHAHGWQQVLVDAAPNLIEVGFALVDHGAHPNPVQRPHGHGYGLEWTTSSGADWSLWVLTPSGNLTLTYEGPLSGLYGVLPTLLPPAEGYGATDAGSAFTRHLSDRYPQLRPLNDHEVEFGRQRNAVGHISLPASDEPTDTADDARRVVAEARRLGTDLLLTAVPHLV